MLYDSLSLLKWSEAMIGCVDRCIDDPGGEDGSNINLNNQTPFIYQCLGLARSAAAQMGIGMAGLASLPCSTGRA